jgi:hypothetical protein
MIRKMKIGWKTGGIILLVAVIAMGAIGISYSANGNSDPSGNSLCTFSWVESNDDNHFGTPAEYPSGIDPGDNGNDPYQAQAPAVACGRFAGNVATTTASIDQNQDTISFTLSNAYPGYYPTVFFGLSNQSPTPGIVQSINIQNPDTSVLTITLDGIDLNQIIDAGKEAVGALSIGVGTQPGQIVPQGGSYTVTVTIVVTQWTQGGQALVLAPASTPAPTPTQAPTPTPAPTPAPTPTPAAVAASWGIIGGIGSGGYLPLPVPTPTPETTLTATPTPTAPVLPTPTSAPPAAAVSWSMIGGIIGAALLAALLFFFLMRRRRRSTPDEET